MDQFYHKVVLAWYSVVVVVVFDVDVVVVIAVVVNVVVVDLCVVTDHITLSLGQ